MLGHAENAYNGLLVLTRQWDALARIFEGQLRTSSELQSPVFRIWEVILIFFFFIPDLGE